MPKLQHAPLPLKVLCIRERAPTPASFAVFLSPLRNWGCVNVRKDTTHIANHLEKGVMFWHEKLGHLNMASLKELDAMVDGMNLKEVSLHRICEGCVKGTHERTSFPKDGAMRASKLLEIVHINVCGPMRITSHSGVQYF